MPEARASPPTGWKARRLTIEAMFWLLLAWLLIHGFRFGRWHHHLGLAQKQPGGDDHPTPYCRYLANVVTRGAMRLKMPLKCLPRAMALHWMLRRRGVRATLVIGMLPGSQRGTSDDLHAWVEMDGETILGDIGQTLAVVGRFSYPAVSGGQT